MIYSIIVPVYNVDKYIDRCVQSLMDQETDDCEIILVDDASTDRSLNKLEQWEKRTDIIKVIRKKKNSGLSDTRNTGLIKARGDYIFFVDSDDYVTPGSISRIMRTVQNTPGEVDIVFFGFNYEGNRKTDIQYMFKSPHGVYSGKDFMRKELKARNLSIPACMACYRREFLLDNKFLFQTGILHEDVRWSPVILYHANKVIASDESVYHYYIRDDSITQKRDRIKNGVDLIDTCFYLLGFSGKINDKEIKKLFKNYIATMYLQSVAANDIANNKNVKVDRWLPFNNTCFIFDKVRSLIFAISPVIYSKAYNYAKKQ